MSSRRYQLHLGYMELKAIEYALGNSMEYSDVVESLFPEKNERSAAIRGYNKVVDALKVARLKNIREKENGKSTSCKEGKKG